MNFKLYLENEQDDIAFIKEFFQDLNRDVLLVWADYLEEKGETKKAELLRGRIKGSIINMVTEMGGFQGIAKMFHAKRNDHITLRYKSIMITIGYLFN